MSTRHTDRQSELPGGHPPMPPPAHEPATGDPARAARATTRTPRAAWIGTAEEHQVRSAITRSFPRFLARYPGVTFPALLRLAGIDPAEVATPDHRISLARVVTLLRHAAERTGDPLFGLDFGAQLPLADTGVLGYVMRHSPTLGAALENLCRYYRIQQTSGGISLDVGARTAELTFRLNARDLVSSEQHQQVTFAYLVHFVREATGRPDWKPVAVRFSQPSHGQAERYERLFRTRVVFDEPSNVLVLDAADLDVPLVDVDEGLYPILQTHAEDVLERVPVPSDLVGRVRQLIGPMLVAGDVALETIAARLGTSPRTLQRRLQALGQPYQQIVDDVRLEAARRHLRDPSISLTDVAFLLGYSDLTAFSRAFRRWTGKTPLEFRRRGA